MNSRQRVFATVGGEPVDRRPFTAMLSLYGAELIGCPLVQYYTDPSAYARGQTAVLETFGPDVLFSPFSCPAEGQAFGSEAAFFDNQPPNLLRPAISSAEDIPSLKMPDVDGDWRLAYVRRALEEMAAAHGGEVAIAAVALSPVDLPLMIMGMDGWLNTVLFDADAARRMLDLTVPFFVQWANTLLAGGADFVAMPAAFLNPSVVTPQIAREFSVPILREAFAEVRGPLVVHHVGSPFLASLDTCTDLPNVAGFALDHRDDLSAAREILGPDVALLSGPSGPDIGAGSAKDVEARCTQFLNDRRGDPRFILATCGPDIPLGTPAENIHALRRAVMNFDEGPSDR